MEIISNIKDAKKWLYIDGDTLSKDDEEIILDELSGQHYYVISFINTKVLPQSIIKRLYAINTKMELYITDRILWLYLKKLDINCTLKGQLISQDDKILSSVDDNLLDIFLLHLYEKYGYDFRDYDKKSIKRRVELAIKRTRYNSYDTFFASIINSYENFYNLFADISINVTTFFRNPQTFKILRDVVLPYLDTFGYIRIWSAGCASGEEAYSIAIMLDELGLLHKSQIYATDFNNTIIQEAKNGIFPKKNFINYSQNYRQSGGTKDFTTYFEQNKEHMIIKDYIKEKILFFTHNLATDTSMNDFELILCRNTIIYFDQKLKQRVLKIFFDSLKRGGVLLLGETENINNSTQTLFSDYFPNNKIYKKLSF